MAVDICYKKNFLTNVIARVDFLHEMRELSTELPYEVTKAALVSFPIPEPQKAVGRQLQLKQDDIEQSKLEFMQWIFHGKEREKRLVVVPSAFFVEFFRYLTYEEVRDQFLAVLQALKTAFGNLVFSRLGLRYINNISQAGGDPFSWTDLIDGRLLSVLDFPKDKASISRSFHNLEFNFGDYGLRYQFGIINPDYPAAVRKRNFILDLDAYYQGSIDISELGAALDSYHNKIQELFESSITSGMRRLLDE